MQLAPSSGVFYILDTTVNSDSDVPLYNGMYLKYVNVFSESTINNSITLYRGSYDTGKTNGLIFHSGWRNEMKTDFFGNRENVFSENSFFALLRSNSIATFRFPTKNSKKHKKPHEHAAFFNMVNSYFSYLFCSPER